MHPLNFHATHPDKSGLKEQSPKSVSTAWRGGGMCGGRSWGSREPAVRSARSEAVRAPASAEQALAGLVTRRAGRAMPRLPRRPLAPPHASARLPFKREA